LTNYRPTYAQIDLGAIRSNVETLGSFLKPGVERLAVVKANAYGHGDVEVARACIDAGATRLGVALVEEGIRLREAGIDAPILVLIEAPPEAAKAIVANDLTPSVFTRAGADALSAAGSMRVHVCVDTGMHREGTALDDGADLVAYVAKSHEVEGLWSHLAVSEEEDNPVNAQQIERFASLCDRVDVPVKHLANSGGIVLLPDSHHDLVRMGIALYGLHPGPATRSRVDLAPAMRLVSAVGSVRRVPKGEGVSYGLTYAPEADANVVTVLIGYGDGYPRALSNNAEVLVSGRRRRVAGRVTMDSILVDCADDDVAVGDEVVLIGEEITADEVAEEARTINYEVVTAIGPRVPRTYA
jgi:alanine racemase